MCSTVACLGDVSDHWSLVGEWVCFYVRKQLFLALVVNGGGPGVVENGKNEIWGEKKKITQKQQEIESRRSALRYQSETPNSAKTGKDREQAFSI